MMQKSSGRRLDGIRVLAVQGVYIKGRSRDDNYHYNAQHPPIMQDVGK
jgi:hypothetical protein